MAPDRKRLGMEPGIELCDAGGARNVMMPTLATRAASDDRAACAWSWSLLLVGPLPPPSGGMANQTLQLAALLAREGCRVTLVRVNEPYRPSWVGRIRGVRALFRLVPYLVRLARATRSADIVHVMANSGWAWHLFAAPAIWIGSLRSVPVIVNYRGGEAEAFLERQAALVTPTLRRAFAVVVPSAFLVGVLGRFGVTTQVVANIIDLSRFHPGPSRPAGHHIIVTRNLEDIYDIPTALRAFAEIRRIHVDATLTVAGSGPRLADLQTLCQELGIAAAVQFTGRLDNELIANLYRRADLMLNPSTADNMPISLLEAMASGVPIVSTDVGGIPHLATNGGNALLVPARNPAAMAAAGLRVLAEPALAASLTQAGYESASKYTWAEVRPRLLAVYVRALDLAPLNHCTT